jgi:hypothetical protein
VADAPRTPDWLELPAAIHHSGWQSFLAVTGGGSGAISTLLETPGASRSILGAVVPYAPLALAHFLGSAPEQYCSAATARAMAVAAFRLARQVLGHHDPERLCGVACTASLATNRPKRGDHRVHVAAQTVRSTTSYSLLVEKGRRDRAAEELVAARLILRALAATVGVGELRGLESAIELTPAEHVEVDRAEASPEVAELWSGVRRKLLLRSSRAEPADADNPDPSLLFPGAFNPPHAGHLRMASIAEQRLGKPLAWELSIANVDKPTLDFIAIRDRVAALDASGEGRPIALTSAPTFREKATLFPGATFVVGADTLARIAHARYYHGDESQRDEAIDHIAARGCRFLAFGRHFEGGFQTLADLALPARLRVACDEVPAADFREDISSTELRAEDGV